MSSSKKNESPAKNNGVQPATTAGAADKSTLTAGNTSERDNSFFATKDLLNFDADWDGGDPLTAPRLADLHRTKQEQLRAAVETERRSFELQEVAENSEELTGSSVSGKSNADKITPVERLLGSVNQAVPPVHHLIAAALLTPSADLPEVERAVYELRPANSAERRQKFWQLLAARGVSAKEAALLDDSLSCSYLEIGDDRRLTEVDWEVVYRDPLEGCAEIYLAEMFLCKQPIYEAGDDLRVALEVDADDLALYLEKNVFAPLVGERIDNLLLDALSASFTLTVSTNKNTRYVAGAANSGDKRKKAAGLKTGTTFSDYFNRHATGVSRRVESWLSGGDAVEEEGRMIYRLRLGEYWLEWQRAARAARFDFDYLRTLPSACAVRFYELTKLWRAAPAFLMKNGKPSLRLEIEYEQFAALMPLPQMVGKREIKQQIADLIKPLKTGGYVKSFSVEPDWRDIDRRAILVFRFAE